MVKSQAKSCDPKNTNSGAKHNMSEKLYLLSYIHAFEKHDNI